MMPRSVLNLTLHVNVNKYLMKKSILFDIYFNFQDLWTGMISYFPLELESVGICPVPQERRPATQWQKHLQLIKGDS